VSGSARIEELRRRVQADPTSVAFAALAEEYRRAGQYEEAIEVCRTGLTRHPAYLSARVTLGRVLIELDRLDEAELELSEVLRAAPENLAATRALGDIHTRRGDLPPAAPAQPRYEHGGGFELDLMPALPRVDLPATPAEEVLPDPPPAVATTAADDPVALDRVSTDTAPHVAGLQRFLDAILARKAARADVRL
jgi:tetratricopeptide (TPR) repeat protein